MHTLVTNLSSLWKVVAAGLVFGAGLPMIFAFGVRLWSSSETRTDGRVVQRDYPAFAGALVCLGLVIAAVVAGVLYTAKAFLAARFGIHLFGES